MLTKLKKIYFSETLQINGSHSFLIKKKTVTDIYYGQSSDPYTTNDNRMNLNITVTDELTQKKQSEEVSVELRRSSINLEYSEYSPKVFKPGFPYEALVSLCFVFVSNEMQKAFSIL